MLSHNKKPLGFTPQGLSVLYGPFLIYQLTAFIAKIKDIIIFFIIIIPKNDVILV